MASTTQSARDYVENARVHLVRELKNLSVIVENLYQQKVFSDEEVSKIQTERDDFEKTRKILDSVTKKGEAACYKFLRIIDMTRKRTVERASVLPEKQSAASTENRKFDLHHWISCYPFKEDTQMDVNYLQGSRPCHRYQAKLKSKAQKISNKFWMANKNLFEGNNPNLSYTALVLDKQGGDSPSKIKKLKSKKRKLSRPKKMKTYIPKDRPGTSPSDLLKTDENILLVGKPGIGKTALSHELLRLWAERDNEELDYMFYFDMRETSHITRAMSLEDLLFSVFSEPDEGREEVLQDIKRNSDNVTIIFDGITDLSSSVVKKLVEKDLLPDAKVIVTCRPDNEEDFGDFLRVEVKGFSEQTIKTYLSAMLGDTQKKVLSNLELLTLCHVPMYALMVAACFSSETPEDSSQPCSITEIYINIVRFCLKMNSNKTKNKDLNSFIENKSEEILSLAEVAFHATEGKTVNLTKLPHKDSCVLCFLKSLDSQGAPTETITTYAFLHYTMQEFFAAIWLLKNPDKIKEVFQQCLTTEKKHMKHLIPFMCRLLTDKSPSLMKCLIPAQELINTSNWFFKEMINRFFPYLCETDEADTEDSGLDVDILFLCQCLFESQCPEACVYFLDKLDYRLDLSGESLGPYPCCAVAYVVTQSKEKKIYLNLEDVMVSEQGMRRLFGCLQNVQWCDPLPRQLWEVFLLSEEQMDYRRLLGLGSNQLHLPVEGKRRLFERAVKVMQKISTQVNVCLHCDRATPACQRLHESLLEALPYISSLSFSHRFRVTGQAEFFGNLFCAAAEREQQTGEKILELLSSVCRYQTFPLKEKWCDFQLDLYSYGCETGLSVLPSLQSVLQSAPAVWSINLSERKTSILLEVLKLQSEKKQVELTGCSHEESEVRSFLQCLPYISQFSFVPQSSDRYEETKFFGNLFCAAAEREQQTGEKILELLSLVCSYKTFPLKEKWWDFLLDLYSYGCETGLSVLPSLQSVLQSAPAVWSINLSERKPSILLEVLKLQSEKKQVKLTGCSHEESEVRSFLQCLPYISQLSFVPQSSDRYEETKFFGNLFCAAAEREQQTGEKILELLSSVCSYKTFPLKEKWWDFLLDLYSYGCETGLSVLPSLQSVLQSAPAVWSINLSERKPSILLEVLKLQSEKKQVKLTGCSHEEIEVRSFLQCLPYISQLSFVPQSSDRYEETKFFGNLFCAAAEREQQTGEKILELLSSVCSYKTFPLKEKWWDFLLDLYSYYCETGLSVLPSLQSVLQSAPAVWSINLSERKPSILLEVLKLQSEKKPVELTGCSYEESEVRSFLQCLPYISQLSVCYWLKGEAKFFGNLFCAAAEREQQTGEKILELLSSVCRYKTFPLNDRYMDYDANKHQCDVLLDLYSHLKDYETKTGLSVLPSLQSVLQSAPAVWFINLSERKTSILLEVLKLQSEKKQVELTGCSHEESEVRSFLQCLPYISQLSCDPEFFQSVCTLISVRSREDEEQLSSLLQLLGYTLQLTGELHTGTCRSVGRVLRLCGSDVDLILKPRKMSVRGASLLFRHTTQLHSLSLSSDMALLLFQWVRRGRAAGLLAIEELSLTPQTVQPSERVLLKVVSSLASLLRYWSVRQLDLTEFYVPAQGLIPLLLHHGPLTIKLREKISLQLLSLIHEIQDKDLTQLFLSKVGGDLSSCCLNWELLHCLLQQSLDQIITVNLRKNRFLQENVTRLLPFLDKIVVKRPCPRFVLTAIREIYKACASPIIPSLLRSLDHVINLTCREMDSVDCAALLFTLKHSDRVKLNLVFTSIPTGQIESILFTLDKVSQLSVDRNLLLRFIHCCAASDAQQGAAVGLLRALQHRLDLSCSSCVDLPEEGQSETLSLTAEDCRAVSTILRRSSSKDTQLNLQDCELEDSRLDLLFPVLDRVRLRASKALLLQLLSLVPMKTERDTVRRAVSLCRALGGELDLSHTTLDQRACEALAQMLDFSEGLTDLDLSHCELTDQLLFTLITHLHKVQVLDLSHNKITDAAAHMLLQLVSINPSIDTVRLFSNNIVNRNPFKKHQQFEIW
ncbi:uncharacterized protein LOC127378593 isoform X29 [Dicentrarchus labrax]|uniref:uncharacterized protein LOC127378593 isoform X27 n=1 Tax=Dicentrarchus labrax TaxID=13489 RepID=UPI0021F554E7|nr:uncharacterized protein LOC127378593 isoform X27 [Dicentrarchus labrax]XP_051283556.1 uncharacterized protein LOC127378593 isoform X29 [Dicentrarchus labrax]